MKLFPPKWKPRPVTSRDLRNYAVICACGAVWNVCDLYRVLQWSHGHDLMQNVDSRSFSDALRISFYGPPDLALVPALAVLLRIVSHFTFWFGGCMILAVYGRTGERPSNALRLVGFLYIVTSIVEMIVGPWLTGQTGAFLASSFSTVRGTLTMLVLLGLVVYALFPRRAARLQLSHA